MIKENTAGEDVFKAAGNGSSSEWSTDDGSDSD
jgi:hypothetical protein